MSEDDDLTDDDFTKFIKGDPVSEDDDIYQRYAALEERHRKLQGILFVVCACLGPLAAGFIFYPRTVPQALDYCDTLRAAAHELEYSPDKDKDPTGAKAALDALTPLIEQCPEKPENDE